MNTGQGGEEYTGRLVLRKSSRCQFIFELNVSSVVNFRAFE